MKENKFEITIVAILVLVIGLVIWEEKTRIYYKIEGTVVNKYITQDRNGTSSYYHIIIQFNDGRAEDRRTSDVSSYAYYKEGGKYIFETYKH